MSEFYVGQRVVCVDDSTLGVTFTSDGFRLKRGTVYTVTAIRPFVSSIVGETIGLQLSEHPIDNGKCGKWRAGRFRPVESKAMSIFRAIAADPSRKLEDA